MKWDELKYEFFHCCTPIKCVEWEGYWQFDKSKNTIFIYCKDKTIIDIRNCEDLEYTFNFIATGNWEIATCENCKVLKYTIPEPQDIQNSNLKKYVSVKYAYDKYGNGMSDNNIRRNYVGIAHYDDAFNVPTESNLYDWSPIDHNYIDPITELTKYTLQSWNHAMTLFQFTEGLRVKHKNWNNAYIYMNDDGNLAFCDISQNIIFKNIDNSYLRIVLDIDKTSKERLFYVF